MLGRELKIPSLAFPPRLIISKDASASEPRVIGLAFWMFDLSCFWPAEQYNRREKNRARLLVKLRIHLSQAFLLASEQDTDILRHPTAIHATAPGHLSSLTASPRNRAAQKAPTIWGRTTLNQAKHPNTTSADGEISCGMLNILRSCFFDR